MSDVGIATLITAMAIGFVAIWMDSGIKSAMVTYGAVAGILIVVLGIGLFWEWAL